MNRATTSTTTETATWPATRIARPQRRRWPGATLSPDFITAVRSARAAWSAGTRPKSSADDRHQQAEHQRAPIHAERERDRQVGRDLDLPEQQHAGVADAESDDAAGDRDQQALGNELT